MAQNATDVKVQPPASSATASPGSAVPAVDANPQSAPSHAPAQGSSAPATKSMLEVVRESLASKDPVKPASSEPEAPADPPEEEKPEAPVEEPETAPEETTEQPTEETDKGPVPYSRFTEVNEQRKAAEKQLEDIRPVLDAYGQIDQFCTERGLTNEDFSNALILCDALKNDPERAIQLLGPRMEQLQTLTGANLPPELAQAVENGEMTADWAKKLAAAQGKSKLTAAQAERQAQRTQQQLAQQQSAQIVQEVQTWLSRVQIKDTSFRPKAKDAPNGPYEMFLALFEQSARNANPRSAADYTSLAQRAYDETMRTFKGFEPRVTSAPRPRSNQSSVPVTPTQPKSVMEAVSLKLKERGINFPVVNGSTH